MKKYNVIVTQHNDEEYIFSYNIIPSPITKLWEKCIISAIENDKNLTCFSHIDCGSTYQNTLDQINYYCNKINKEGILIIKDVPKLIKECTQEFLNKLHKIFHMYTEKAHTLNLHNDTRTSLLVLNNLIHELDHMTTDKETSFNLVKMHFEDDHIYDIALADSHYPYFNYIWEGMGYLRLGYATLGKTLHACYIENDIDVIKEKLVKPQTHVSTEVYLIFEEKLNNDLIAAEKHYHEWCTNNNVYAYGYDPEEPQHKYTGKPLLGKLNTELDLDFVKSIWCGYKSIRVEIE